METYEGANSQYHLVRLCRHFRMLSSSNARGFTEERILFSLSVQISTVVGACFEVPPLPQVL